jgi:hypothetical protein
MKEMTAASLDAHPRYLLATDVAAFVLGTLVLAALGRIPRFISPLAIGLLVACLAILLGLDLLRWHLNGIRSLRLEGEDLTVYRGPGLAAQQVPRRALAALRVSRRLGKRTAVLRLGNGKKLRISEDAFPREAFGRFLSALEQWARPFRALERR